MKQTIRSCGGFQNAGKLVSAQGGLRSTVKAAVGEQCEIWGSSGPVFAESIGFDRDLTSLLTYQSTTGLDLNALVVATGSRPTVPVGPALLGRVIDGLGRPSDSGPGLDCCGRRPLTASPPDVLNRAAVSAAFQTGIRAVDGLLTIGVGQRIGVFAGTGVGKSTLLGEIAAGANSDVNVVALIGERGREVAPFIEKVLGQDGMRKSVVIVASADHTALMRVRATEAAVAVAEYFRDLGLNVLLIMDSVTRFALAARELGLTLGEPPSSRGFPPSVFQRMAELLERLGNSKTGSITGVLTVLVEGDDIDEPIADNARSILDGHIILSRKLANAGHYPSIDVTQSISRLAPHVSTPEHTAAAAKVRSQLATLARVSDIVEIGAYKPGSSAEVDKALQMQPHLNAFLQQSLGEHSCFGETVSQLHQLSAV